MIKTVLFDLDGTLVDTAPDLARALNYVLEKHGQSPLPFEKIRPVVSHGGIALITLGFGKEHPEFETLRQELLDYYRDNIADHSTLFEGMPELLELIETRKLNWGIVTNKPDWLTDPLLDELQLSNRSITTVSGNTLEHRKPHPAPMLHACKEAGSESHECLYIGDAQRDIEAGKNAGMKTAVAMFGYIGEDDQPENWNADMLFHTPGDIVSWVSENITTK